MSARRLVAIAVIYVLAAGAWATLGTSIVVRTGEFDSKLTEEVSELSGRPPPSGGATRLGRTAPAGDRAGANAGRGQPGHAHKGRSQGPSPTWRLRLSQSRIQADLQLTNRQKGLLWYHTYGVRFSAHFTARNPDRHRARDRRRAQVPVERRHLRPVRLSRERRVRATGQRPDEGPRDPRPRAAGQRRLDRRRLRVARHGRLGVRLRRHRRRRKSPTSSWRSGPTLWTSTTRRAACRPR